MEDNLDFLDNDGSTGEEEQRAAEEAAKAEADRLAQEAAEAERLAAEQREAAAKVETPEIEGMKQAYLAERRKRQEVEAELARKSQEEKPFLGEEYEQRFTETESKFEQRLLNQKLDLSEAFAREKYADFDDKLAVFADMVKDNPDLYRQMVQQINPADFAYKTAVNQQKLKDMGDPSEYEKKLRAQIEAEVKAKYEKQLESEGKKRQELPGTLADAKGAAGSTTQTWSGPTPLADLF